MSRWYKLCRLLLLLFFFNADLSTVYQPIISFFKRHNVNINKQNQKEKMCIIHFKTNKIIQ